MNIEQEIVKLTAQYYELVSQDHHKDKDCYFYINKVWGFGQKPIYRVIHEGYVSVIVTEEFADYELAAKFLRDSLKTLVKSLKSRSPANSLI